MFNNFFNYVANSNVDEALAILKQRSETDEKISSLLKGESGIFVKEQVRSLAKFLLCYWITIIIQSSINNYDFVNNFVFNFQKFFDDLNDLYIKEQKMLLTLVFDLVFSILNRKDLTSDSIGLNIDEQNAFLDENCPLVKPIFISRGFKNRI